MTQPGFKIREGLVWVGAPDPGRRLFDIVMPTPYGTTYNSYVLKGDRTAVIETADEKMADRYMKDLGSVTDLSAIDYIILDHTEPDHSGSLARLLGAAPKAKVIASKAGARFAREIVKMEFPVQIVGEGDTLDLGRGRVLRFIDAPFLHWPDTIFTWLESERVLFSGDAFGAHLAGDIGEDGGGDYAKAYRDYFDAIMRPFSPPVRQAMAKLKNLPVEVICPAHGPVHLRDARHWIDLYEDWAAEPRKEAPIVLIAYASAYGYTKKLAEAIAKGVGAVGGVVAHVYDMTGLEPAALARHVDMADGLLVGSPTMNRDAVPPAWVFLSHVSAVINRNKPAGAFGSYGWSGEAVKLLEERMKGLQLKVPLPGLKVNFAPSEADLAEAREFGKSFATLVREGRPALVPA
ncbi:MAG: FprA family A-type flavoprotein [Bacillota bacterium]